MAPETLENLDRGNPVYTKETDVWSYGVTVWEIFAKGQLPRSSSISLTVDRVKENEETVKFKAFIVCLMTLNRTDGLPGIQSNASLFICVLDS